MMRILHPLLFISSFFLTQVFAELAGSQVRGLQSATGTGQMDLEYVKFITRQCPIRVFYTWLLKRPLSWGGPVTPCSCALDT
ncbi:hypothetical protein K438DRAFT_306877 [Mycena galopus ATCC 62051]|nr:hypothetical protein K438DRAFT_306877 [Mycena galopus ATCC 62051]